MTTSTHSDLVREVRRLAFPAIVHSLLQTLVFVVDRVMLGQHSGTSLAAMQLGGSIEWSIWSVFASFEVGTIALVGCHVGAGDRRSARRAAWISIALAMTIGSLLAIMTPIVLSALPWLAQNVSAQSMSEARAYLSVTMAASPVVFVAMTAIATLQAGGDTKTPLAIGVVANIVHIASNRVLILGLGAVPAMGARGAAISTAMAFGLQGFLATIALSSRSRPVSLRRHQKQFEGDVRGRFDEARRLTRIAFPALVERVVYHAGNVGFVLMIARLGDAAMAVNQSLISVESICFLSGDGFGIAAAALVAQKLGAAKADDARKVAWIATRDAALTLTVFGALAFVFRDQVLPIFSKSHDVLATGRGAMPVLAFAQPFMATGIVLAQSVRGAGHTRAALGVSIVGAVFVRLSMTWLFAIKLGFGLAGVWVGSTLDWVVRSALLGALASPILGRRTTSSM
ncbi:MAG: MATE family efflux transporter [Polyangiaceae bacterium]|nr:MATE family efflux transporter [Polyangiaceae bacterium]